MLICLDCAQAFPSTEPRWRCGCGGRLKLDTTALFEPADLARRPPTLWRYREALGLADATSPITLGEGFTPLVPVGLANRQVLMKLDFLCPTGSYKDRGSTVMVSKLAEWGVGAVIEDSSGNAGASVAAYCALAGIRADIYIPESTSSGKAAQIAAYGAKLARIPGTREDTARAAWDAAMGGGFYASHNWSPYFLAGLKTLAYEIAEQLDWRPPEWVVTPAGNGGLAAGLHQGFRDLAVAGIISQVPRLVAVQASNCAPIWNAWQKGLSRVEPVSTAPTAAEGIASARPVRAREVLEALAESRGLVHTVSEDAIWRALAESGERGLYIEPTSATAVAAAAELIDIGTIPSQDRVVVILTGSGLKATDKIVQHLTEFPRTQR